ncbi:hypothetical protein BH23GEM9_BH23GEM9_23270 [soil metagenome]
MPGMCGAVGVDRLLTGRLLGAFCEIWPDAVWHHGEHALIAAHAHSGRALLTSGSTHLTVDGDAASYVWMSGVGAVPSDFLRLDAGGAQPARPLSGNVALLEEARRELFLVTAAAGGVPLYYCRVGCGLAYSSHIRPLAKLTGASADAVGVAEFLSHGATFAGRSLYTGISRMRPGQMLSFHAADGTLRVQALDSFWGEVAGFDGSIDDAADASWNAVQHSIADAVELNAIPALMLSGGWDSRTLLAACLHQPFMSRLHCYSHGDLHSREMKLTTELAQLAGATLHAEPLDHRLFDDDLLQTGIRRSENVVFPHWHRAGRILATAGVTNVLAGIYGELLGGHYGLANLASGWRKALRVATDLYGGTRRSGLAGDWRQAGLALLRRKYVRVPRYLSPSAWPPRADIASAVGADIETDIEYYEKSGVVGIEALVETHHHEYRAGQYVAAQLLSARAYTDVSQPLADARVLRLASSVPVRMRIHNRLNQRMLSRYAPETLRFPMGATLVRADKPVGFQEVSRVVRHLIEDSRWRVHFASGGAIAAPRYGWVNFEFLREPDLLLGIVRGLNPRLWNLPFLEQMVVSLQRRRGGAGAHPVFDQLMRLYTVDRVLSPS